MVPNGVDLPLLSGSSSRPTFMGSDDRKVLLFLGRIHRKKGLTETVAGWGRALSHCAALGNDWVLVIAGWDDGGELEVLKRQVDQVDLKDHVYFPGPLFGTEKEAALRYASAFVLASHSEGVPMSVLEAWAHSVPVFMTAACNLSEGFAAGAAYEISTEPEAIARAFIEKLIDPQLSELGRRGRSLVEVGFSWDKITERLVSVYNWIAGGGDRPADGVFA